MDAGPPRPEPFVVQTTGLTKRYRGGVTAVADVDLRLRRGEIYGFLGRNGAGKSTTIRLLLGMLRPTSGRVALFGQGVRADAPELWSRVGHLVETPTAYGELTARENLRVGAALAGVKNPRAAVDRGLETLGLERYADRRAGTLSHGNRQRLALARALVGEPDLLVLDEPANGLDPAGVVEVRDLLRSLARERGATVFMSSHILSEVERLATRIGVIHRGRLIEELDSAELERHRRRRLEVRSRDLDAAVRALESAGYAPARRDGEGGPPRLELAEPEALSAPDAVSAVLAAAGAAPTHLAVVQEDLEAHFLRLTGGEAQAGATGPAGDARP